MHLGEVLLGYANAADDAPPEVSQAELAAQDSPQAQRLRHATHRLLRNGSFLVVRKLRQDIGELEAALDAGVDAMPSPPQDADAAHWRKAQRELLLAKMMGRWPMDAAEPGKALASSFGKSGNDFNFNNDARGGLCPFHAHIAVPTRATRHFPNRPVPAPRAWFGVAWPTGQSMTPGLPMLRCGQQAWHRSAAWCSWPTTPASGSSSRWSSAG